MIAFLVKSQNKCRRAAYLYVHIFFSYRKKSVLCCKYRKYCFELLTINALLQKIDDNVMSQRYEMQIYMQQNLTIY